ncbi:MAG TPA: homoserine kinase, partial [Bacillota bacterium]
MNVEVIVPASVANLGPGFDCLGMAVDAFKLRLRCRFDGAEGVRISVGGSAGSGIPDIPADNLIARAMEEAFASAGARPQGYELEIDNGIPLAGGLGSSAAAVVG